MELHSLCRKTDFIVNRFEGEVTDRGDYIVVKTISNPTFHWGNYIIFSKAPKDGDCEKWQAIYRKEFHEKVFEPLTHMTFTWDTATETRGRTQPFTLAGFKIEQAVGLTASEVQAPTRLNENLNVRAIATPNEWEDTIQLQIKTRDPRFSGPTFEIFKRKQFETYRAMAEAGKGFWFGGFLEGKLVTNLGIFHEDGYGRFQSIGTDPAHRRQGASANLIYKASKIAGETFKINTFVVETDEEGPVARICKAQGFSIAEKNYSLSWY